MGLWHFQLGAGDKPQPHFSPSYHHLDTSFILVKYLVVSLHKFPNNLADLAGENWFKN